MSQKVALVLSSGGPRGFAYIGAIEELESRGYEISAVAGTSIGSLIGGIYAAGKLEEVKEWLFDLDAWKVFSLMDISLSFSHLVKGDRIIEALKEIVPDVDIEDLKIPYRAIATDFYTGEEVIFEKGNLFKAIRASISIPSLFRPAETDGRTLIDGGIANVIPLNRVERTPGDIMVAFDVNAHGIPNGQPKQFYADLNKGELKGYSHRNKNSRDQFYFKDMFLRVMRALDYVKTLPEWNGKVLIVTGGSQGGGQALVAAALDPQVTLCVANVPAIGDHAGRLAGRRPGWPQLMNSAKTTPANQQVIKASGYFDHNYFAKRIKCETYTGTGFVDFVCPPTSVYAAFNNLPAKTKKYIQTTPTAGHGAPLTIGYKRINQVLGK